MWRGSVVRVSSTYILEYSFDDYAEMVRRFHGSEAPGVLIGGFMVALAVGHMRNNVLYDAISETKACLPDAIQLLTPCTTGNGWLKIFNYGRYALTLYDKENDLHEGVRVFIDTQKVREWPEISAWFLKLKSRKDQTNKHLIEEIRTAGDSILSVQYIRVRKEVTERKSKGNILICPKCREAYPAKDGETCLACQDCGLYV